MGLAKKKAALYAPEDTGAYGLSAFDPPFAVCQPVRQTIPFVFCSPHSGRHYPASFLAASNLDASSIRRSEDAYIDELFAAAPEFGAPLIHALFPRAFLDANREPYELDPKMFDGPLPGHVNTQSQRVADGLGTIARVVTESTEIYRDALPFAEAEQRIQKLYVPFHARLKRLMDETSARFGYAVLIDCHSMPSVGGFGEQDRGTLRPDVILGDRFGTSCSPHITAHVEQVFRARGYQVTRNNPYAGGFNAVHYGQPFKGQNSLQIEFNRALYMRESSYRKSHGFKGLQVDIEALIATLIGQDWRALAPAA